MRKLRHAIASVSLTVILCASLYAQAFSDIADQDLAIRVSGLSTLGIMNGISQDLFAPNNHLTRAEFAKIAVVSLGKSDVSAYNNFTIFPDVRNTHWASGYINAAVREFSIIKGLPDGTFAPDKKLTLAESVSISLSMLGYTVEDIGSLWPTDYMAKANSLGILEGVKTKDANSYVPRSDAAILLNNVLTANKKGGSTLLQTSFGAVTEGYILVATSETNSELSKNQAVFYDGSANEKMFEITSHIPANLIGSKGTIVLDSANSSKVKGFVPNLSNTKTITVDKAYADKIVAKEGEFKIPSTASVVINGKASKYSENYYDVISGYNVTLFYDINNEIDLVSVAGRNVGGNTFVFGTSSAMAIPADYRIVKNGVDSEVSYIKQYDVVNINDAAKLVTVTDRKISGLYSGAAGSFSHPTKVTVLGNEILVPSSVAAQFKDLKYNDKITLLLDSNASVVAVYPASQLPIDMVGSITEMKDNIVTIDLLNGLTIKGKMSNPNDLSVYISNMVSVSEHSEGSLIFKNAKTSNPTGNWDIKNNKLGDYKVSANVKVFEKVSDIAPINQIPVADIALSTISKDDIRHIIVESGQVTAIVLKDITGNSWDYGYLYVENKDVAVEGSVDNDKYTVTSAKLVTKNGEIIYSDVYPITISGGSIVGVPKNSDKLKGKINLAVKPLIHIGVANLDQFDGVNGVKLAKGYYKIVKDVPVYSASYKKFITLEEAKADFNKFKMYIDFDDSTRGTIRMFVVD